MKIIDKSGKVIQSKVGRGVRATKRHHKYLFDIVTRQSVEAVETDKGELVRLQEVKDHLCSLEHNPFNMNLEAGEANAKVRHWFLRLVTSGVPVEVNGKIEVQKLEAFEIGDAVVYANLMAMKHHIAQEKDKQKKVKMQARFEVFSNLPRRETYYK